MITAVGLGLADRRPLGQRRAATRAFPRANANGPIYGVVGDDRLADDAGSGRARVRTSRCRPARRRWSRRSTPRRRRRRSGARTCGSAPPTRAARRRPERRALDGGAHRGSAEAAGVLHVGREQVRARTIRSAQSGRQVAKYDQKTRQFEYVDTCFSADHNMFDANNIIYFGMNGAVGWVDVDHVGQDARRRGVAGLVPGRARHQRRRQDHAGWTEPDAADRSRPRITASSSAATRWPSIPRTAASGARGSAAATSA